MSAIATVPTPWTGLRPAVRLTARGRRLGRAFAVLVLLLAGLVLVLARADSSAAGATRPPGAATVQVVVAPGQSLWSISRTALPGEDVRVAVARIASLNGLDSGAHLRPGQALIIPAPPSSG